MRLSPQTFGDTGSVDGHCFVGRLPIATPFRRNVDQQFMGCRELGCVASSLHFGHKRGLTLRQKTEAGIEKPDVTRSKCIGAWVSPIFGGFAAQDCCFHKGENTRQLPVLCNEMRPGQLRWRDAVNTCQFSKSARPEIEFEIRISEVGLMLKLI